MATGAACDTGLKGRGYVLAVRLDASPIAVSLRNFQSRGGRRTLHQAHLTIGLMRRAPSLTCIHTDDTGEGDT